MLGCRELGAACLVARQQSSLLKGAQHPTGWTFCPAWTFSRMPNELWMSQPGYFHELPLLHCFPRQLSCGCKPPPGPNTSDIKIIIRKKKKRRWFPLVSWQDVGNPWRLCGAKPQRPQHFAARPSICQKSSGPFCLLCSSVPPTSRLCRRSQLEEMAVMLKLIWISTRIR